MEEGKLQAMPNIKKVTLSDGIKRDYIDTYGKLHRIVKEKFEQRKNYFPNKEPKLVISNMIIAIDGPNSSLELTLYHLLISLKDINFVAGNEKGTDNFCKVQCKIAFENTIIYKANFAESTFFDDVTFTNTKFILYANFAGSVFNGKVTFESLEFKDELNKQDNIILNLNKGKYWLDSSEGKTIKVDIKHNIDFSESIFNGNVCFDSSKYVTTEEGQICTKTRFDILSNIILDGSHFNKKFEINHVTIGSISMINCRFNDTVGIIYNHYDKKSKLTFSFSTINCLFIIDSDQGVSKGETIKLSNEISFYKSLITKDAFILIRNINNEESIKRAGTLDFRYANILGTVTIQDSKLDRIKLDKSTLIGDINIENVETEYDSRESIAKVKDSHLKRNDIVNFLAYKAKEMKYYSEHLNFKSPYLNKIVGGSTEKCEDKKVKDTLEEYVLLNLNRISNSFGMSWERGVCFTCVTALLFFVLINTWGMDSSNLFVLYKYGWDGFGDIWKNYLHMFYLLDFKDKFSEGIKLNAFGETLFFVSKIFVSYGIYQTISAFRKYGK